MHDLRAILKTGMVKERYSGDKAGRRCIVFTVFLAGVPDSEQWP